VPRMIALQLLQSREKLTVYIRGGVASYESALQQQQMLLPQDGMPLPADHRDLLSVALHLRGATLRNDEEVDCLNRLVATPTPARETSTRWILQHLAPKK
jgi:hypothetical protein